MVNEPPPRLSQAAREAIRGHLAKQRRLSAVSVSRVLRDIRTSAPALRESDEDLIQQIAMDAVDSGLALHFDKHTEGR